MSGQRTIKEDLTKLLKDAKVPCSKVYLKGDGNFVYSNGNYLSPFDILKALHDKQDAIERGLHFISALQIQ